MFGVFRVALRAFVVGFAAGLLVAPRAGSETRRVLSQFIARTLRGALDVAALPAIEPRRALPDGAGASARRRRGAHRDAGAS